MSTHRHPPAVKRGLIGRGGPPVLALAGLFLAALALLGSRSATANPDHSAGDYFVFSKTVHGIFTETNCNGSNDKQADISGSFNQFWGRIHSNADIAVSGQNNTFKDTSSPNPEVTYGTHDEDCQAQAEAGNNYNSAPLPTSNWEIDTLAYQVDPINGWPGNLGTFLRQNGSNAFLTFQNGNHSVSGNPDQRAAGMDCDFGNLSNSSDITLTPPMA
jgi:hypothetical protein